MIDNSIKNLNKLYLTPQQAAEILNVSVSTLKKLIYSGKIKTLKTPGGHHRIPRASLLHFENTESSAYRLENTRVSSLLEIVEGFIKILENRLKLCRMHSITVANLSVMIGQRMGFASAGLHNIKLAALLHDIGKFSIGDDILNKATPLTPEEYALVKSHPLIGFEMLSFIKPLSHFSHIIRQHHEKYDGSGYPEGLKKKGICTEARIIALAESFDAMTSRNSYREPLPIQLALEEVRNNSGRHFDPGVSTVFLRIAKERGPGEET